MLSCYILCRSTAGCSGVTWGGEVCRVHLRGMSLWERRQSTGSTSIHVNCGWNGDDYHRHHPWNGRRHEGTPNDMAYRASRADGRCGPDFRTDNWVGSPDQAAHCQWYRNPHQPGPCCSPDFHCGNTPDHCTGAGSVNFSKFTCFNLFYFFFHQRLQEVLSSPSGGLITEPSSPCLHLTVMPGGWMELLSPTTG